MTPDDYCTLCSKTFDRKVDEVIEVAMLGPRRRLHAECWFEISEHKPLVPGFSDELMALIEEQENGQTA